MSKTSGVRTIKSRQYTLTSLKRDTDDDEAANTDY